MSLVEKYVESGLSVITLADSENGNRLNIESLKALHVAFNESVNDEEVRVILLRSNGTNFCLGMDLVFLQNSDGDRNTGEEAVGLYVDLLKSIYKAPKAVIAFINGNVKAGGIGLIGACDIIVASEKSTFELSEVLLGLIPANVLPFIFSTRISPQKARYIILTAAQLSAHEAKEIQLIDKVFGEDRLEKGIKGILKTLFRAAPGAVAETKKFTEAITFKSMDEACSMAKEKLLELISNPDVIKAVTAFNEGDMPEWFDKCRLKKSLI